MCFGERGLSMVFSGDTAPCEVGLDDRIETVRGQGYRLKEQVEV